MPQTPFRRRQGLPSHGARIGLVILVALASVVAAGFGATPATRGDPGAEGRTDLTLVASTGHPDFVGVGLPRPSNGPGHIVASGVMWSSLVGGLVLVGLVPLVARAGGHPSRRRRWRARLEGAPPIAS